MRSYLNSLSGRCLVGAFALFFIGLAAAVSEHERGLVVMSVLVMAAVVPGIAAFIYGMDSHPMQLMLCVIVIPFLVFLGYFGVQYLYGTGSGVGTLLLVLGILSGISALIPRRSQTA